MFERRGQGMVELCWVMWEYSRELINPLYYLNQLVLRDSCICIGYIVRKRKFVKYQIWTCYILKRKFYTLPEWHISEKKMQFLNNLKKTSAFSKLHLTQPFRTEFILRLQYILTCRERIKVSWSTANTQRKCKFKSSRLQQCVWQSNF